ncbi:hypothetical protein O3P69_017287 [Scylla paramamosain]|uniref:Uncharacterized protein n=1 Tax=Scylla paramamosain TaxID=85552 RepID=A0AAW0TVC6_SCYPA
MGGVEGRRAPGYVLRLDADVIFSSDTAYSTSILTRPAAAAAASRVTPPRAAPPATPRPLLRRLCCDNCGRCLKSEVGGPAAGARQVFDPGGGGLNLPPLPLPPSPLSSFPPSDFSIVALPLVVPPLHLLRICVTYSPLWCGYTLRLSAMKWHVGVLTCCGV